MAEVTGGVSAEQLRSFIERLENLEEEKRAVQEQLKEVFAEAKGEGFDVKVIGRSCGCGARSRTSGPSWTSCWRSTSRRSA
jgi:uncharacterized protein (UPF0335 family)